MNCIELNGAEIDHCHRCGGTLVEPRNIKAHYGTWAQPGHWVDGLADLATKETLRCPVDRGNMTGYKVIFEGQGVVVDHCDLCGSLWLDRGEGARLARIVRRSKAHEAEANRPPAPERDAAADALALQQDVVEPEGLRTYLFQLFTGLPIEVWNPVRGHTPAMKMLVVGICVVYALQIVVFVTTPLEDVRRFLSTWGMVPELVAKGEHVYTLFTYMFLHSTPWHLIANAYSLWIFGDNIEDRIGTNRFVLLYFAAGVFGAFLHFAVKPGGTLPVVGASGAIAGLMGAYMVLFPRVKLWVVAFFIRWRIPVFAYLGFWLLINLIGGANHASGVAWFAHIGGFAMGLLAGWLLRNTPHPYTPLERKFL